MPRRNFYILVVCVLACLACAWKVSPYGRVLTFTINEIADRGLEPVDQVKLFQGAMKGMTDELDPYSLYMPPAVAAEFNLAIDPQFGGLGIEVLLDPETQQLTVASPLVGTPAYEAGIRAGDKILRIDGRSTQGLSLPDAVNQMRGKLDNAVTLTVLHLGETEPEDVRVVRAVIQVPTVLGDTRQTDGTWDYFVDGNDRIGYLRITTFGERTAEEVQGAVKWLVDHRMRGLILDFRNNPGGLLRAAIDICDLFVDSGTIVSIRQRDPEKIVAAFSATDEGTYRGFPIVVLVNEYSASASEIVAACLQDHRRAVVVGTRSFGKGTVQELIELPPGDGTLKLTTSSYWRPSGRNINRAKDADDESAWGVSPNAGGEVKLDEKQTAELALWRRQRDLPETSHTNGSGDAPNGVTVPEDYFDPQLKRAIEELEEKLGKPT